MGVCKCFNSTLLLLPLSGALYTTMVHFWKLILFAPLLLQLVHAQDEVGEMDNAEVPSDYTSNCLPPNCLPSLQGRGTTRAPRTLNNLQLQDQESEGNDFILLTRRALLQLGLIVGVILMVILLFLGMVASEVLYLKVVDTYRIVFNRPAPLPDVERLHP